MVSLSDNIVDGLIKYLATRPYAEVAQVMPILIEAYNNKDKPCPEKTPLSLGQAG